MSIVKLEAIIVAAGRAQRMGDVDKIFVPLGGKPLLAWSVDLCQECDLVEQVVVVLNNRNLVRGESLKEQRKWTKVTLCLGGLSRQDSVKIGLSKLKDCEWVMIHDGARPFLTVDLIQNGMKVAMETGASAAAVPIKNTIKLADDEGLVKQTLERNKLWAIQTPQIFSFELISKAYGKLTTEVSDDAAAVEHLGQKVKLYMGNYNNIKVTTSEDLKLAGIIARDIVSTGRVRVGMGYDSHPLVLGRKLILGGVHIPYDKGLLGYSDADVATHAIVDALCGAADLGDIGTQFPSGEVAYKDVSSLFLLRQIAELIHEKGFTVINVDVTIIAEQPKLSPFVTEMRKNISQSLGTEPRRVTVKATTTNGLGFVGRKEGITAQAVALVQN